MTVRPLRSVLTLQALLATALPFVVVAFFGFFWILPQAIKDVEVRQLRLARAVAAQVESHLEAVAAVVRATAAMPRMGHDYQQHLDSLLGATNAMNSLYVVDSAARISSISLKKSADGRLGDLNSLDLSGNPLFLNVTRDNKPRWSTSFLSVITGGLSVAYAVPAVDGVFVGEVDLLQLTQFLKQISTDKDALVLVVDHKGQVVADNNGRYTAQQLNINNIPLVGSSLATEAPVTARFAFEGQDMTGSMVQIPDVDWHLLVARTDASIYQTPRRIGLIVMAGLLIALVGGIATSVYLSRKLAERFDALADHAQRFAEGDRTELWPLTSIAEFNQLSDNLQHMAHTLHQQEETLREIEALQSQILNSTCDGIYGIDNQGFCTFANTACLEMLGYERPEELLGRNIHELIHHSNADGTPLPVDKCRVYCSLLEDKGVTVDDEVFWNRDGRSLPVEYSSYPIRKNGKNTGAVISWRDVTERKRAENERLKFEQQLLHAQKLESLGVLAGGIAHDFNNILTAIIGNADLALMRINKESPAVDNLHRIEMAASQAADLAKQMLAYSGKGKFLVENLDLNRLLEEMLHMLEISISKKAVLRLNLTTSLPTVEVDATQVRQVIMNLVINASEAIGDKSGVISISTGCMDCDQSYLKDVWLDESLIDGLYVYLEIADSGCGMDKETMAKIFDPFFTTKFTGRGLGMAAVQGIVRGHKGAIKVYSEPGKGSSFKILLPASGRPADIINGETAKDDWRGSGTVLLVDDEETIRGIGSEMLKELGFSVVTANDGRAGLELFKSRNDIAFVVLDLTMPHMDGDECFRELRRCNADVKVIMSSGYSEHEVTQKFIGKGLAGFIQKPYKLSELKKVVRGLN